MKGSCVCFKTILSIIYVILVSFALFNYKSRVMFKDPQLLLNLTHQEKIGTCKLDIQHLSKFFFLNIYCETFRVGDVLKNLLIVIFDLSSEPYDRTNRFQMIFLFWIFYSSGENIRDVELAIATGACIYDCIRCCLCNTIILDFFI